MPATPDQERARGLLGAVWVALIVTCVLGVMMRWQLAGSPLVTWPFLQLRHGHMHLGYYGVLFPALWAAWRWRGAWAPTGGWAVAYGLAVLVSTLGFLWAGYGPMAIVGSTVVGLIWLVSAWCNRSRLVRRRDWLGSAPLGILLAGALIPAVAYYTPRDLPFATALVRTFLALLVYAVVIPAALARLEVRPPRAWLWLLASIAGAVASGLDPSPWFRIGLLWLAGVLALSVLATPWLHSAVLFGHWMVTALGLAVWGAGLLPPGAPSKIAGLHYVVLAPLLISFFTGLAVRVPAVIEVLYHGAVVTMVVAIFLQAHPLDPVVLQSLAAAAGTVILLVIVAVTAIWLVGRRNG